MLAVFPATVVDPVIPLRDGQSQAVLNADVWLPRDQPAPGTIIETDKAILLACEPERGGTRCVGAWRGHLDRCDGKPNANAGLDDAVLMRAVEVAAVAALVMPA